ncbi:MAG: L-tyrosine isonitrile synthase [Pseudonocardiales bacterium]|nr:L-tyrosine isonitrile synthase [Pseudonocardiales bacterium]
MLDVETVDPWFVMLSPTEPVRGGVAALGTTEPEPEVIESIDHAALRETALAEAETFIGKIRPKLDRIDDPARRIFEIMACGRYRAGSVEKTRFTENWELWQDTLRLHVEQGTPIPVTLPSYPFKIPNPVKVRRRSPDMAELLNLQRLIELSHAISLVHEPGAVMHVISDGMIYGPLFGVSDHEARCYRADAEQMIRDLDAEKTITMVDMLDDVILDRHALRRSKMTPGSRNVTVASVQDEFDDVKARLEPKVRKWWDDNADDAHRKYLVRNLTANMNTHSEAVHLLSQVLSRTVAGEDIAEAAEEMRAVGDHILKRADEYALRFTLTLYTLRVMNMVQRFYPQSIRGTVHPKPGQWGFHLVNKFTNVFPWQGVAVQKPNGQWRVRTELDAKLRGAIPVHLPNDPFPYYYREIS